MAETWLLIDIFRIVFEITSFFFYLFLYRCLKLVNNAFKFDMIGNTTYETSAQIKRVLWRRKLFIVDQTSPRDFLTWHGTRVHPNYVLRPNVSLYAITKKEAVFVETPVEMDIYKSDINPFLYMSQFFHCQHVIIMPIESFHKLAREVGQPSGSVIWLSNTARCGSTIIGQLFESVSSTVLISESDSLTNLSYLKLEGKITKEGYDRLFDSVVKIICKPHPGTKRFCVKPRSCAMIHMEAISRLCPKIKQLFLYRNSLETLSSLLDYTYFDRTKIWIRCCNDSDVFSWFIPFFRKRLHYYMAFSTDGDDKPPSAMNTVETVAAMWASFICLARNMKSRDGNIHFVKYEDLVSDPQVFCKRVFLETAIDLSETEEALGRLQKHSQRKGVDFDEDFSKKNPWRNISEANGIKVNAIFRKHNVPLLGEDVRL